MWAGLQLAAPPVVFFRRPRAIQSLEKAVVEFFPLCRPSGRMERCFETGGLGVREFCFAAVVFATYCIQGVTGFGGTVLALPFAVRLVADPRVVVPVLTLQSLIFCACFLLMDRSGVVWRKVGIMVFYLSLGAPVGVFFFKSIPPSTFKPVLGALIVAIALWGIARARCARLARFVPGPILSRLMLVLGGAVQGSFGSGGPFVMLYAETAFKDKGEFRTSLLALWFLSNLIVVPQYFLAGIDVPQVLSLTAWSIPAVLVGLILSLPLHRRLGQRSFLLVLYAFLFLAGLFTLLAA